jgi:hypothetical protein
MDKKTYHESRAEVMWQSAEHWLVDNFQLLANCPPEEKLADIEATAEEMRSKAMELQFRGSACPACLVWSVSEIQPCRGCPVADKSGKSSCRNTPWPVVAAIRADIIYNHHPDSMYEYRKMCDKYYQLLKAVEEEYQYLVGLALEETEKAWRREHHG